MKLVIYIISSSYPSLYFSTTSSLSSVLQLLPTSSPVSSLSFPISLEVEISLLWQSLLTHHPGFCCWYSSLVDSCWSTTKFMRSWCRLYPPFGRSNAAFTHRLYLLIKSIFYVNSLRASVQASIPPLLVIPPSLFPLHIFLRTSYQVF